MFVTAFRELGRRVASPTEIWFYPAVVVLSFGLSDACAIFFSRFRIGKILFP